MAPGRAVAEPAAPELLAPEPGAGELAEPELDGPPVRVPAVPALV